MRDRGAQYMHAEGELKRGGCQAALLHNGTRPEVVVQEVEPLSHPICPGFTMQENLEPVVIWLWLEPAQGIVNLPRHL